jgi:hypothetical protein
MSTSVVWVKVVGAGAEGVTFVDCDPSTTNIARLKKLVKNECSRRLEHVDALDLIVRGVDGEMIEEDLFVSDREEGRDKATAFTIEVPHAGV